MDSDRSSHRTGDLFVCFTARNHNHSSSMRSILSPNRSRPRDPPISLTTSLSRRLRTSRSIKGAASPAMFPTSGKKRSGNGFDNPEPSSPKVTCIGQVRVKAKKKQGKKQGNQQRVRSLSRRHSTGDVSFRKLDNSHDGLSKSSKLGESYQMGRSKSTNLGSNQDMFKEQRNSNNYSQKWVHLPLTICEALRAFGSEFSCLFPCRSSCFSSAPERKPVEETGEETGEVGSCSVSGSCAKVFTRWLLAYQDGDDGSRGDDRRDSQLVVNNENEEENCYDDSEFRVSRRHVFNDLEIVNNRIEGCIDEARVSICIPPKNALLLMRCRSDPLKMEALANRLWESTTGQNNDDDDDDDEYFVDEYENDEISHTNIDFYESRMNVEVCQETKVNQEEHQDQEIEGNNDDYEEDFETFFGSLFTEDVDEDNDEILDGEGLFETGDEIQESETGESNMEKVKGSGGKNDEEIKSQYGERSEMAEELVVKSKERESEGLEREGLPECLLLMMCEPKLSMEVCKETWVSSKDFFRRPSRRKPPPPPPLLKVNEDGQDKSKVSDTSSTDSAKYDKHLVSAGVAAPPLQPRRSSCSLPVAPSMAEMLEQKLVNAVGYEPFVLTRCKSEPMRTAAAKLAPDSYFWKNRKLEPLRRASFGVGSAGLGF